LNGKLDRVATEFEAQISDGREDGARRWLPVRTIRYKVTGPALDRGSCHCRSCRKASSAPELPYAQFAVSEFAITRGRPAMGTGDT
jgi:hypothetical protein